MRAQIPDALSEPGGWILTLLPLTPTRLFRKVTFCAHGCSVFQVFQSHRSQAGGGARAESHLIRRGNPGLHPQVSCHQPGEPRRSNLMRPPKPMCLLCAPAGGSHRAWRAARLPQVCRRPLKHCPLRPKVIRKSVKVKLPTAAAHAWAFLSLFADRPQVGLAWRPQGECICSEIYSTGCAPFCHCASKLRATMTLGRFNMQRHN